MSEAAQRWRLVLGKYAEPRLPPLAGEAHKQDMALGFLYDRLYGGRGLRSGPSDGQERSAGLEASAPRAVDWLDAVNALFPADVALELTNEAVDRFGLTELLSDPRALERVEADIETLKLLLSVRSAVSAEALAAVPWADDYVIPVGWTGAMVDFDAMALAAPGADGVVVDWSIPEDFTDEPQRLSLASFLGLEDREYDLLPRAGCCVYGDQADIVDGWFGGLPTITFVDRKTSGWQNVHLFVEPTDAGPRIVGVAVEIWTP